jgi:hypothetical protein
MLKKLRWALAGALLLAGCAENPHAEFYTNRLGSEGYAAFPTLIPHHGEPEIRRGNDPQKDSLAMREDGYEMVGFSVFEGPSSSNEMASIQARKVNAAVALIYSKYNRTQTGAMPLTQPNMTTAQTNGSVTGYGGPMFFNSATTVNGTTTTMIPYSVDRYEQASTYWVKAKSGGLCIFPEDLTLEQRQQVGTNNAIAIAAVRKGSAAYRADIMTGDILLTAAGQPISIADDLDPILKEHLNKPLNLEIWRNGQVLKKQVTIEPYH